MTVLRWLRRFLLAAGLLLCFITGTPVTPWWVRGLAGSFSDPKGDVLVVLGGSVLDEAMVGKSSYWRATYAGMAWRAGGFRSVVLVGGGPGMPVSVVMRDFLVASGVPGGAIVLETASTSTRENALYTKKILDTLKPAHVVLLTSDFHMYRAVRAFRKAGIDAQPRPIPHLIKEANCIPCRWPTFFDLCQETAKIAYYHARGWM